MTLDPAIPWTSLPQATAWMRRWLATAALPVWATLGQDHANGGFREALTPDGQVADPERRARVQARQVFVFARAADADFAGPWIAAARRGMEFFLTYARRADGLLCTLMAPDGEVLESSAHIYDQAFALLALAALAEADGAPRWTAEALRLRSALDARRHPPGGFREAGPHPFQATGHMHLLEAALAWEAAGGDARWATLADEVAGLALTRFVGADGALRNAFDADWTPLAGDVIQPGHQFEWAWLLERWGRLRGRPDARAAARRLYAVGRLGVDAERGVAIGALSSDLLSVRDASARLWAQTEHLKAALILGEEEHALQAARSLRRYLQAPANGLWRDRMKGDGAFVDEAAPASSFYHILGAFLELEKTAGADRLAAA
ncbi:AGE family epimerase/isomerase [Phenylobacterium sp.]|jgi:mannose-1-phosphate guanylyltransferase/mannose-6-phosphate isomerase|uniref:AGE family epimerase/isomerase n=1 Tax=Phenylobacterium sp. TaxID=1871053 RepID=UPI003784375D